jgi:hypothetical protein
MSNDSTEERGGWRETRVEEAETENAAAVCVRVTRRDGTGK